MDTNPFLGILMLAIGGLLGASFYVPYRGVRSWSWESYWLAGGVFSWIIGPWLLAFLTVPNVLNVLYRSPLSSLVWSYAFGVLWGVGGLTFGLAIRYLGVSLGYAIAIGFCAAFGTLMPPIFSGEIHNILASTAGRVVLSGVAGILGGVVLNGLAGISKERELSSEEIAASVKEFNLVKGILVGVFAGVMAASLSYGIVAGKPIAAMAIAHGAAPLWQNTPLFVVILAGGFTTNFLWCAALHWKNGSSRDYLNRKSPLLMNYVLVATGGTLWYVQFMFYGMGETKMGQYKFSSWTVFEASIMIFSVVLGIALKEWRGSSIRTRLLVGAGLATLVASTAIVGYGNYLGMSEAHQGAGHHVEQKVAQH
jgi:L-rhamnose-H+ transport protein